MRVEVRHFAGGYYTVHYAKAWYLPMKEWGEPERDGLWSCPSLIDRKNVCLMSLDVATSLANSLTLEKVLAHERALADAYRANYAKTKARLKENKAKGFVVTR